MGDAADDAFDAWCEAGCPEPRNNKYTKIEPFMWLTSEGDIIHMRDMDTSHIENAINKCIQYNNIRKLNELRQILEERNFPDDGYQDYLKRIGQI